jgi:hypothetical protein
MNLEVAQEALDNIKNGPLLILGGEKALEIAIKSSQLTNRGDFDRRDRHAVRTFHTSTRTRRDAAGQVTPYRCLAACRAQGDHLR